MPLATMAAFMPAENQAITPRLVQLLGHHDERAEPTKVSQALFSDKTSSQSMVP